jgi:GDP/UDP-N,N'-diacetylbacillosamine 2-epimerase (hydrolysing)
MKRKICVVTGSRAEYGLLYWLLKDLAEAEKCDLKLVVTGMHLAPEFGNTVNDIEEDGFFISEKVEMLLSSDSRIGTAKSTALGTIGFAETFNRMNADLIVILGDRFEIFAAAQAAMFLGIPIAHIHGGEITEGAIDECMRHAITKMSHLHFCSAEIHRKRVLQLGEDPKKVFNVGAAALDGVYRLKLLKKKQLQDELKINFDRRSLLVTFHPATIESLKAEEQFEQLTRALQKLSDTNFIFTLANADTSGRKINQKVREFVNNNRDSSWYFNSLGHLRYLSLLKVVDGVVGNSSSGLIEAPSFGVGTLNIGDRQKGRLKGTSVLDCEANEGAILNGLRTILSDEFRKNAKAAINPYGNSPPSAKMVKVLCEFPLDTIIKKSFFEHVME